MISKKQKMLLSILVFISVPCLLFSQSSYELNEGWKCAPVSKVSVKGTAISLRSYSVAGWLPATVPGTVLTTLLNNKLVPDPFYGMNNQKIPDIYATGRDFYTYWFVKDFKEKPAADEQVWLHFRGVNYGSDIYLNGHKLNEKTHFGMFLRQTYNISDLLSKDGNNRVAVLVYPPDPVGNANGGQGGDGEIARNVTHQYVAGWDWIQPVRDRNTGIWDKVTVERTFGVNVKNPQVVTLVPGLRLPGNTQQPAVIKVTAEVENPGNTAITGSLQYHLHGAIVKKQVTLPPKTTTEVSLPEHTLRNPKLWWPNGYGEQALYTITLEFEKDTKQILDKEDVSFGIREIRTKWNAQTNSREVSVNGQKVFVKGGNWIVSDAMLRFSSARYDTEVRFHRDMNLNLMRVWGGALTERPEFYEACDRYGMLVFQDFWFTGDCNGKWKDPMKKDDQETRRKYPDNHSLTLESLADQIKMIRNYPSLAFYCGGNEITPPAGILTALKDSLLPKLDNTRYFFDYSNSDSMSLNTLGGNGDGPYGIQNIDTFWARRTWPFNSEIGSVGTGDYESLERFIPTENLGAPPLNDKPDSVWQYHKYLGYDHYINRYGTPKDVKDFALKAQLVNYDQYRGLVEGFTAHMWDWYTGVIIWKTQNPWTALRGQMYDYYLDPNAGLYGLQLAGEPVHVMYNPVSGLVMIANNTFNKKDSMLMEIKTFDRNGKLSVSTKAIVHADPSSVKSFADIKDEIQKLRKDAGGFLSLRLLDANKQTLSNNFYWLADSSENYTALQQMRSAKTLVTTRRLTTGKIEVRVTNPAAGPVAFFNRISLVDAKSKKRILPVFYSDNYISVLPGESKTVVLDHTPSSIRSNMLVVLKGWNVNEQFVAIK